MLQVQIAKSKDLSNFNISSLSGMPVILLCVMVR